MIYTRKLFTVASVSILAMLAMRTVGHAQSAAGDADTIATEQPTDETDAATSQPSLIEPSRATSQPAATSRPAAVDDPNWIGPTSWQRHFTIPPFVETERGFEIPVAASRPASAYKRMTFFGSNRSNKESGGTEKSTRTRSSRSDGSSRSSRSQR